MDHHATSTGVIPHADFDVTDEEGGGSGARCRVEEPKKPCVSNPIVEQLPQTLSNLAAVKISAAIKTTTMKNCMFRHVGIARAKSRFTKKLCAALLFLG